MVNYWWDDENTEMDRLNEAMRRSMIYDRERWADYDPDADQSEADLPDETEKKMCLSEE